MSSAQGEFPVGDSSACLVLSLLAQAGAIGALASSRAGIAVVVTVALALFAAALRDLRGGGAVVRVRVRDGKWHLVHRDGREFGPASPLSGFTGSLGLLLVLRAGDGSRAHLALPAAALDPDHLRRLRVHAHTALTGGTP